MSTFVHHHGPPGSATGALHHPLRTLRNETHLLLEVERAGESGETPFLAIAVVASVVLPIGAVMMLLAFAAAWLFG
jgi:hypothetical protein